MSLLDYRQSVGMGLLSSTDFKLSKSVRFNDNPVTFCASLTDVEVESYQSTDNTHTMSLLDSDEDEDDFELMKIFDANSSLRKKNDIDFGGVDFSNSRLIESTSDVCMEFLPKRSMKNKIARPALYRRKPNSNNNFVMDKPEDRPKWADVNVFNRTKVLAQPKPLPKGYKGERECTYWISKKPPPIPKAGYTVSNATPRLEQLAKPLYSKGEWTGERHCHWEQEAKKQSDINPNCVDWDRLATPKTQYDLCLNDPKWPVSKAALNFETTKRLTKLALPKKSIDCGEYYMWLWNYKPDTKERLNKIEALSIDKTDMEDARILLRCDLDYTEGKPIETKITDILPTIRHAFNKKARAVIIISHCGDPNGVKNSKLSLEPLMELLKTVLPNNDVVFMDNCIGAEAIALCEDPEPGHVFLLENLRFHPEEMGYTIDANDNKVPCTKESIKKFRKILFNYCEVFVNDALTLLHTDSATNYGDPKKERCYGFYVRKHLHIYNFFVSTPKKRRLVAILGGTYKQTADLVSSFMGKASEILLGGEIATMFLHAVRGFDIGETECSPYHQKKIKDMMTRARDTGCIINLPSDLVVEHVECPGYFYTGHAKDGIDDYYRAVDIGPLTRECYKQIMLTADQLVWHGPMGELCDGTCAVAQYYSEVADQYGILTYLPDAETLDYFRAFVADGKVTCVTENSELTLQLMHRKLAIGLAKLSPARRRVKKRPPKPVWVSKKPTSYVTPCMKVCNAMDRLCIDEVNLKHKNVVIRSDLTVHMTNAEVTDNYCVRMAIPSIRYALQCGANAVIVLSSLGMLHGKRVDNLSLRPVAAEMAALLNICAKAVVFVTEPTLTRVQAVLKTAYPGTVLIVENVNFREEESLFGTDIDKLTQKEAEKVAMFCEEISLFGDVYVNDTFRNSDVSRASGCGMMLRERSCGFLLKNELRYFSNILNSPQRPFLVILGGDYSDKKMDGLKCLLKEIDELIITGGFAITFLKVISQMPTGACPIFPKLEKEVPNILDMAAKNDVHLLYPVDFLVADELANGANTKQLSASVGIPDNWFAVDIGNKSCSFFKQAVKRAKLILWHGVVGRVEYPEFMKGSKTLHNIISEMTQENEMTSILCGHSTKQFVGTIDPEFKGMSHVSTGGLLNIELMKDKCLLPIRLLSAGRQQQSLSKLNIDQVDVSNMSVLLRAHVDEPLNADGDGLLDTNFIKMLIPTIKYLQRKGARSITIVGSKGEPKGKDPNHSLRPAKLFLENQLKQEITFFENGINGGPHLAVQSASGGQLFMLENLRFHPEERGFDVEESGLEIGCSHTRVETYKNKLTALGNLYVNDSISALSSCDTSVVGIRSEVKVAGLLLKNELSKFRSFVEKLSTPFLAIVGSEGMNGAYKLPMLYDLLDQVTNVILCGDIAYTYIKTVQPSAKLEKTPFDAHMSKLWPRIIRKAKINGVKIHLPTDFLINEKMEVPPEPDPNAPPAPPPELLEEEEEVEPILVPMVKTLQEGVGKGNYAMDIGPASIEAFTELILEAKSILLMGPAGCFTDKDYEQGSKALVDAIGEAVTENDAKSIGLCLDTYQLMAQLDNSDAVNHVSLGTHACVNMMRNVLLPGLEILDPPKSKLLKKLSVQRFNVKGKRVLLRLDLDVPVVEDVILDVSKVELSIPTIRYLLEREVKSLVLMGHRGEPKGFKNSYLSLEPLAKEYARVLGVSINFLPYPCSAKTQEILQDPEPGSVFLMENLKFYPSEGGKDFKKSAVSEEMEEGEDEEKNEDDKGEDKEGEEGQDIEFDDQKDDKVEEATVGDSETPEAEEGDNTAEDGEDKREDGESQPEDELNDEFVEFTDGENLDRLMYEEMAPKSVEKYIEELSACGDILVIDNLRDLHLPLTSMTSLTCARKMCGLRVSEYISKADSDAVYKYKSVASLSVPLKDGEMDDLILP